MAVWTIVVAAGAGSRFGSSKQFERLGPRRVVDWAVQAARAVSDGVVVVVPAGADTGATGADTVVGGGPTRSASVRAGLGAVPRDAEVIIVHDAARPLAPVALFEAVVAAVRAGADGAVPAVPVSDTVKRVLDGRVVETLDRTSLVAAQTPQAFAADALRAAHQHGHEATDDASLLEALGAVVRVVDGSSRNLKLTHPQDLAIAALLLEQPS